MRKVMNMQPKGRAQKGRTRKTWSEVLRNDLRVKSLTRVDGLSDALSNVLHNEHMLA